MIDRWIVGCVIFFFKQKTAYEMRISDWSSDVCSSDLLRHSDGAGITAGVVADGFRPHPGSLGRMMATADKRAATHSRSCNDYATHLADRNFVEIGRASCRERVFQYV